MQQRVNGIFFYMIFFIYFCKGFTHNITEAKEVMKQNLLTIQQILNSFVSLNEMISTESFNIYNFQNRKFQIGQWIDVKESSESWVIHNFLFIFK